MSVSLVVFDEVLECLTGWKVSEVIAAAAWLDEAKPFVWGDYSDVVVFNAGTGNCCHLSLKGKRYFVAISLESAIRLAQSDSNGEWSTT